MTETATAGPGKIDCGIIMPISATENFTSEHWIEVQTLLHRAISEEGFSPHNVWDDTGTDRISERVIGNIFRFPIVVAVVSDLNPNVMFELGLRLASKKPTVVVQNEGGRRAFDISDFHALPYPSDLNMLKMEKFLSTLRSTLTLKYNAAQAENYTPFLGSVIVDVLSPTQRELPMSDLILSRLDDLDRKIARQRSTSNSEALEKPDDILVSWTAGSKLSYFFRVPPSNWEKIASDLKELGANSVNFLSDMDDHKLGQVVFNNIGDTKNYKILEAKIRSLISINDGIPGGYRRLTNSASW